MMKTSNKIFLCAGLALSWLSWCTAQNYITINKDVKDIYNDIVITLKGVLKCQSSMMASHKKRLTLRFKKRKLERMKSSIRREARTFVKNLRIRKRGRRKEQVNPQSTA